MNFDDIFEAYYNLYRLEAETPASSDDEYAVAKRLANEAIRRWASYDNTFWKELFDTNQNDGSGAQTVSTGVTSYAAPTNFRQAGGFISVKDSNGAIAQRYPIIEPQDAQFRNDNSTYCYFTSSPLYYSTGTASQTGTTITGVGTAWTSAMIGMEFLFVTGQSATITAVASTTSMTVDKTQTVASAAYRILTSGYTLHLNPAPPSKLNGMDIDYVYYKYPRLITSGSTYPEMGEPYFMVHRMLANRFRGSRNPYYGTAKTDAEDALRTMQTINNSGSWADPWKLPDNSGSAFGS